MRKNQKRADKPRKLSPFERETERRRKEMLRVLAERVQPVQNKRLKSLAWRDVNKNIRATMRAKPTRRAPRGT